MSNQIIARLLDQGKYTMFDGHITGENFPIDAEPSLEGVLVEWYAPGAFHSRTFILKDLERKGRRAANVAETLLYGGTRPDELNSMEVFGLGQATFCPHRKQDVVVVLEGGNDSLRARLRPAETIWTTWCVGALSFPL